MKIHFDFFMSIFSENRRFDDFSVYNFSQNFLYFTSFSSTSITFSVPSIFFIHFLIPNRQGIFNFCKAIKIIENTFLKNIFLKFKISKFTTMPSLSLNLKNLIY